MESCLPNIHPLPKTPFKGDLLDREKCAYVLRSMVDTFARGCVISINGKWGTGKTTFLTMWEKYMELFEYHVIHFNSWESEDVEDPLIAIIAEFKKISGTDNSKWMSVASNFGKVALAMLPSVVGKIAENYLGINYQKIAEKGADEIVTQIEARIDDYCKQKAVIDDFKKSLSEYVEERCNGRPLVFVIDELDRCNPSFAVKTLERIKHIFEVDGIVFVIAIDEVQLCHSIKGFYGSEQFDAKDYLRRFFKIQYDLPKAETSNIIQALMERFEFGSMPKFQDNYNQRDKELPALFSLLYNEKAMSIRQLEQYMLYSRLALANCSGMHIDPITVAFIVYIKMHETDFFEKYTKSQISDNEVIKHFEENYNNNFFELIGTSSAYLFYTSVADMLAIRCGYENLKNLYDEKLKVNIAKFDEDRFALCFKDKSPQMVHLSTLLPKINMDYEFHT